MTLLAGPKEYRRKEDLGDLFSSWVRWPGHRWWGEISIREISPPPELNTALKLSIILLLQKSTRPWIVYLDPNFPNIQINSLAKICVFYRLRVKHWRHLACYSYQDKILPKVAQQWLFLSSADFITFCGTSSAPMTFCWIHNSFSMRWEIIYN